MTRTTILLLLLGACSCTPSAEPLPATAASPPSAGAVPPGTVPPPAPAPAVPTAATAATAEPALEVPEAIAYPFTGIATIPDDCAQPSIVLTTAPAKMGWDYEWPWSRQALHENRQFEIVDWPGKPDKPMQVRFDMYAIPGGFALVGVCLDGATCNKLAAMYRATVQSCDPRLHCGPIPIAGAPRRPRLIPDNGRWLPTEDANVAGRCARIGVCLRVKGEPVRGNPGLECQAAPSHTRTECAKKATCDEVVQCLK
jgi:hypothetical protein